MKIKGYPFFGNTIAHASIRKQEVISDEAISGNTFEVLPDGSLADAGWYIWTLLSGKITHENLDTGEVITMERGWSTVDKGTHPPGLYKITHEESSELICINHKNHPDGKPTLKIHHMKDSETASFKRGSKLFVADGRVVIDGKEFWAGRQLSLLTDKEILCAESSIIIELV